MTGTLKQTKEGWLISKELVDRLSTKDLTIKATKYYILIQPRDLAKLTKGMLPETKEPEIEEEMYRLFDERSRQ